MQLDYFLTEEHDLAIAGVAYYSSYAHFFPLAYHSNNFHLDHVLSAAIPAYFILVCDVTYVFLSQLYHYIHIL